MLHGAWSHYHFDIISSGRLASAYEGGTDLELGNQKICLLLLVPVILQAASAFLKVPQGFLAVQPDCRID